MLCRGLSLPQKKVTHVFLLVFNWPELPDCKGLVSVVLVSHVLRKEEEEKKSSEHNAFSLSREANA